MVEDVLPEEKKLQEYFLKVLGPRVWSLSFLLLGVVSYVFINDFIDLSSYQRSLSEDINRFGVSAKYEFALRLSTPAVFWILLCVLYCIYKRVVTYNVIPGTAYEPLMAESQRIMNNSMEQFVLYMFTQLILVTYVQQVYFIVKLVVSLNVLSPDGYSFGWVIPSIGDSVLGFTSFQ